jgi:hypothetical protein
VPSAKRGEEFTRKIRVEMASSTDHLALKKLHIPMQDNLIGRERTFVTYVARQGK